MELEDGTVVRLEDGKAVIQMEVGAQCDSCRLKHCCTSLSEETTRRIELPVTESLHVGDNVKLGYQPKYRIISAFLVFILPLLLLIAGYFLGLTLFKTEGKAILSGFVALGIGFITVWGLGKILDKNQSFIPQIVKVNHHEKRSTS